MPLIGTSRSKTDKLGSVLGHNPRLPCINEHHVHTIKPLRPGSQAVVFKAATTWIETCAYKKFKQPIPIIYFGQGDYTNPSVVKEKQENKDGIREIKYISQVGNHPNIVSFYSYVTEYGKDKDNNPCPKKHTGFLMEYMPGESLDIYLDEKPGELDKIFTVDRVQKWALQIARALAFCHEVHNIIHRDIKPSNVLLSEDYETAKIADFGIARENDGSKSVGKGNPQFQAPETLACSTYDNKADVFSYGCLLFTIIYKRRPFQEYGTNAPRLYNILQDDNNRPELDHSEPAFQHLNKIIKDCWKFKPDSRPTMDTIVKRIINPDYKK